jgi:iron complex transport system ATP-binding protein
LGNQTTILQTKNLSVGYTSSREQQLIFNDLNLAAKTGELHCLLGVNGIGKSTLLRTLAGLQPTLSGEIIIDGQAIQQYNSKQLATKIAVVLTNQGINASLTVKELVEMGRYPYTGWSGRLNETDKEAVAKALALCEIEAIAHKNIHKISDGQLQKTLIARAIAQDCPLMILDEPTVHLDPNNRYLIIELLSKVAHQSNKCILLSTHQVEMAIDLSDKIWLAKSENTLLADIPSKLLENNDIKSVFPYTRP